MRKFLPRGKFWIFNTRRGTSVPARRRSPVGGRADRSPGEERVERQTVAGTRRNFIFPIFCRVPRFVGGGRCSLPNQGTESLARVGGARNEEKERERGKREGTDPAEKRGTFSIRDAAWIQPHTSSSTSLATFLSASPPTRRVERSSKRG